MADKFYSSSRRPLGLVNREGEGNRQKKRRTEDLDLSAVIRIASETTAPGHKGGSDSELSGGLTDEEFDRSGTNRERANCSELEDLLGDSSSSLTYDDGSNSEMYLFHSTPQRQPQRSGSSLSLSSYSSASTGSSVADMIQKQNMLIAELLKKHDSLTATVASVRDDLNETKVQLSKLVEKENQIPLPKGKGKRTYPSALSVSCCK